MRDRFTPQERQQLQAQAWQMHKEGLAELKIAVQLGVAQSTVHYWLEAVRRERAGAAGVDVLGDVEGL